MSANPSSVEAGVFRNAVLTDDLAKVRVLSTSTPGLIEVDFIDSRSTGKAIHVFRSVEVGKTLLDFGAELHGRNSRNETPLQVQSRFGSIEAMQLLLNLGANPNGGPCPHMPSETLAERIELLQKHGWEIGAGQLWHDANHGLGRRIAIWLRYGVNANVTNDQGQTALHVLARRGTGQDAVRALIAAGADPTVKDHQGNTALTLAKQARSQTVAELLTELIDE